MLFGSSNGIVGIPQMSNGWIWKPLLTHASLNGHFSPFFQDNQLRLPRLEELAFEIRSTACNCQFPWEWMHIGVIQRMFVGTSR